MNTQIACPCRPYNAKLILFYLSKIRYPFYPAERLFLVQSYFEDPLMRSNFLPPMQNSKNPTMRTSTLFILQYSKLGIRKCKCIANASKCHSVSLPFFAGEQSFPKQYAINPVSLYTEHSSLLILRIVPIAFSLTRQAFRCLCSVWMLRKRMMHPKLQL